MHLTPLPLPHADTPGIDATATDATAVDDSTDADAGFAPHCPACLHTAEPHQAGRGVTWRCPRCSLVLIG